MAAQRLRPIETTRIEIRRGRWPGAVLAAWSNSGMAPTRLLSNVYGLDVAALPKAQLVVSAGAETLAANIACARLLGASNVFYGSLRRFAQESFDLVLTSYPEQAGRARHAWALKPSPAAASARAERSTAPRKPPQKLALLIGGPSGESRFAGADWDRLLELVRTSPVRWLISNSRRTPDGVSDRLAKLAAEVNSPIERLIDVRGTIPGTLSGLLAECDAVAVTDNSSSMVSDAVAAGLAVVGLAPSQQRLTANEREYRSILGARGGYASVALAAITPAALLDRLARLEPLKDDPSEALAALLAQRLPQLFGPGR